MNFLGMDFQKGTRFHGTRGQRRQVTHPDDLWEGDGTAATPSEEAPAGRAPPSRSRAERNGCDSLRPPDRVPMERPERHEDLYELVVPPVVPKMVGGWS